MVQGPQPPTDPCGGVFPQGLLLLFPIRLPFEARRQSVYQELASLPCGVALVNIRTARRRHPGLDAPSAQLIFGNRLQQTRLRGMTNSGGTMGTGARTDAGAGSGADFGGAIP